jgi:hypothetical protein
MQDSINNNVLHHFTDHSVFHSDSLCDLVDDLIAPMQKTTNALSARELIVLYSARNATRASAHSG